VKEFDNNKLVKLRNPHGAEGAEWTGDWSDKSYKWNQKMKNLLNEKLEQDGTFWMSADDFVYEYRAVYLCRIFTPDKWKKIGPLRGEWKGKKAAGLPSKQNANVKMNFNPHYGI